MKHSVACYLRKNEKIIFLFLSCLGGYGCQYLGSLAGVSHAMFSIAGIVFVFAIYLLLCKTKQCLLGQLDHKKQKKMVCYAAPVSYFLSLLMIMGYQLQMHGQTDADLGGKSLLLIRALFLGIAIFPFCILLLEKLNKLDETVAEKPGRKPWAGGAVFGVSALLIFLCLIPVWLAYYPIVMSYDFHRQVNEAAKGFIWFNPYQPIAHTWIIWLFFQIGNSIGDLQAGMAGMALLHMLLYALVMGLSCMYLYRITKKKWVVVAAVLYYAIFPINNVMVVCTTKDVIFSILFTLFFLILSKKIFLTESNKQLKIESALILTGSFLMQFRNNAIYAFIVFSVIWILSSKKTEKLRILLLCVIILLGYKGLAMGIKAVLKTQIPPAKVEMYSVPIQQFARVGARHGSELDPETWQILNRYVNAEYWEKYNSAISDSVKSNVGASTFADAWQGKELQLLSDWIKIGLKYPGEYIDAFLELTRGYWFLDDRSYAECLGWGVEGRMGILYTYNSSMLEDGREIIHESKFPWLEKELEKVVSGNAFYEWPLISQLFKPSFYCLGLVLATVFCFYMKKKKLLVLCSLLLSYLATLLLGPVVCIRYIFPIMLVFPLLLGWLSKNEREQR